jgi:hypothetical protein
MTQLSQPPVSADVNDELLTPHFLLRVGGLPFDLLNDLRFEQTDQWLKATLELEERLKQEKDAVVEIMHQAVNRYKEEVSIRRAIINAKREIFNFALPRGVAQARKIEPLLASEEQVQLHTWLDDWEAYQRLIASGTAILEQETHEKRQRLKQIFRTPDFRKGILLASPVLSQAAEGYLAENQVHLNREARTVERSLLEYLLRTSAKTSPFSTFTPVCLGTWENTTTETPEEIVLEIASLEKQSFTRLNITLLARLSAQILASPAIRRALSVRVTNGWRQHQQRVEYVRRKPMRDTFGDQGAVMIDRIEEHVLQLPYNGLLRQLLAYMGDGHEERFEAVIAYLSSSLRHEQNERGEALIDEYLQHLLRLGFLIVPALQVNINHPRPLDAYHQKVLTIGTPQTKALAHVLARVSQHVDDYAHAALEERAVILNEIKQLVNQAQVALEIPEQAQSGLALPRTLLYEDTTLTPQRLAIQQGHWREILGNLRELADLFPLFEPYFLPRIFMRGYFQARYGRGAECTDFFSFADAYNSEFVRIYNRNRNTVSFFDTYGAFKELRNYFAQVEINQLNQARQQVVAYMKDAYQNLPTRQTELILGEDFRRSIVSQLPEKRNDLSSYFFFSQFTRIHNEPSLVINHIYAGFTLMFSRFAHCFTADQQLAVTRTLRETLAKLQPAGAVFAELKGGYDATNLNLHPGVTAYELVCPGELNARPQAEQIPLEDLIVQDNLQAGRLELYSKRLGKTVIPVYLGFLQPAILPEIQQILLNFSYFTMAGMDLWKGTQIAEPDAKFVHYPRLRYKQLVLDRETWQVHSSLIPQREKGQSEADFVLALARWRHELHLPERAFVTVAPGTNPENEAGTKSAPPLPFQSRKPLYLDFRNLFSLQLLEGIAHHPNAFLRFTEMLPDVEQLWFKHEDQSYVSEFGLELSRRRRKEHA